MRSLLEQRFSFISVAGEITNLRRPYSGHLYFSLKDSQGQLKAVLFKMQQRYLEQEPADGQEVICHGRISVYEPRGDYQLIVDTIDFHGAGVLRAEFERLKRKLDQEGLFDQDAKKRLPSFPTHITLVTSPRGAAVHDFIRIARRRFPGVHLAVFPVSVQGDKAATEMIQALDLLSQKKNTDVIVLCRGGGSMEDLMPYNDEELARAIFRAKLPVVSAVDHEIDFTIADFVSDLRAPTPSAAAELLVPDRTELARRIDQLGMRLVRVQQVRLDRLSARLELRQHQLARFIYRIDELQQRLDQRTMALIHAMQDRINRFAHRLEQVRLALEQQSPVVRLDMAQARLIGLKERLIRSMRQILDNREHKLKQQQVLLAAVSPKNTLARGYAIMLDQKGGIVRTSDQLQIGDRATILLHRGRVQVRVEEVEKEREKKKAVGE